MKESIYIDLNEDIQSVIQKIQGAEGENLDLVVPTGARILQNIVDAHLIKESGDENGKILTVVTSDLMGRIFAERAGLAVSGRGGESESIRSVKTSISTGRISDIILRKKIVGANFLAASPNFSLKPSLAKAKTPLSKPSRHAKVSEKKSENFFSPRSKGETGADFLKSYREERSKANVFKELREINKGRSVGPFRFGPAFWVGTIVVVAAVVGFIVLGETLPRAEVTLYPSREIKSTVVDVLVSSETASANLAKGIIPGELLTIEKSESGEFAASGAKDVSEKAKGQITIYNNYSAQSQNFIVSRFQTEVASGDTGVGSGPSTVLGGTQDKSLGAGKIFWTTKSVTVPGLVTQDGKTTPGRVSVDVVAAEAGEAYNIGPTRFTMPALKGTSRAEKIYALSEAPMTGGKTGRSSVVSPDDVAKAVGELKEKLKPQFDEFKKNLPNGFQFWPEAYNEELADSSTNPEPGLAAEKFKATIKMVARAVIFRSQDLEAYINQEILLTLDEGKAALTLSKEVSFLKPPVVDYQKGTASAALSVKYDVIDKLDSESFKKEIMGKQEKEIKKVFSAYKNIERVEVKLSPFWVRAVSSNPDRVKIKIVGL